MQCMIDVMNGAINRCQNTGQSYDKISLQCLISVECQTKAFKHTARDRAILMLGHQAYGLQYRQVQLNRVSVLNPLSCA